MDIENSVQEQEGVLRCAPHPGPRLLPPCSGESPPLVSEPWLGEQDTMNTFGKLPGTHTQTETQTTFRIGCDYHIDQADD